MAVLLVLLYAKKAAADKLEAERLAKEAADKKAKAAGRASATPQEVLKEYAGIYQAMVG